MSDAIEKAAIALYASMGQNHAIGTVEESWAKDRESLRAEFRRHAMAALEAVKDSISKGMALAGEQALEDFTERDYLSEDYPPTSRLPGWEKHVFQAMIDAALVDASKT